MRKVVEGFVWHVLGVGSLLLALGLIGAGAILGVIATGPALILERLRGLQGAALVLRSILGAVLTPLLLLPVCLVFGAFVVVGGANALAERFLPDLYEEAWANPERYCFPLFG